MLDAPTFEKAIDLLSNITSEPGRTIETRNEFDSLKQNDLELTPEFDNSIESSSIFGMLAILKFVNRSFKSTDCENINEKRACIEFNDFISKAEVPTLEATIDSLSDIK
jgi:hypothetical protein